MRNTVLVLKTNSISGHICTQNPGTVVSNPVQKTRSPFYLKLLTLDIIFFTAMVIFTFCMCVWMSSLTSPVSQIQQNVCKEAFVHFHLKMTFFSLSFFYFQGCIVIMWKLVKYKIDVSVIMQSDDDDMCNNSTSFTVYYEKTQKTSVDHLHERHLVSRMIYDS